MKDLFDKIIEARHQNRPFVICTVVETKGSTPRQTGAKMLVFENGQIEGTIGGGELERVVIEQARQQFTTGKSKLFRHDLLHQHGMCCGGTVDVFLEPVLGKNKLIIFGAGHTGQALAKMAADQNFEIYLVDDRKEYLDQCTVQAINKLNLPFDKAMQAIPYDDHTFVCIMTYSHPVDREILAYCLKKPAAYIGMIGSERKVKMTKKMFLEGLGFTEEELSRVDMPMGMEIGAEGPEEIALSILAKLVAVKNKIPVWQKELQS